MITIKLWPPQLLEWMKAGKWQDWDTLSVLLLGLEY